jgi:putative transcriptional regulator
MTVNHHPSDETLARFAARTLSAGTHLVLASHIEGCRRCVETVDRFEAVGGALLDGMAETPLSQDSFARTLQMIERDEMAKGAVKKAILASPKRPDGIVLPRALDACEVGPWLWLGPGIRLSRVKVPHAPEATLIMLRVASGRPMPEHGHAGTEYTQLLKGSLIDGAVRMMPGDLMEADENLQHQPIAGPGEDCICLAAVDGKLRASGIIGRAFLSVLGL